MIYSDEEKKIYVEHYDDLALKNRKGYKIIQTKNSTSGKDITNSSKELWKTLRNWSQLILDDDVDLANTEFLLILTNAVSPNSAVYHLKPYQKKVKDALDSLLNFVKHTRDDDIKDKFYPPFEQLGFKKQMELLSKISILDNAPTSEQIENKIKYFLRRSFDRKVIDECYTQIRGWWEIQIDIILKSKEVKTIPTSEINPLINSLVERYRQKVFLQQVMSSKIKSKILKEKNNKTYVKQLRLIKKSKEIIRSAKSDYLLTKAANTLLVEDNPYNDGKITDYENLLSAQWMIKSDIEKEKITKETKDIELIKIGSEIHRWAMLDTNNLNFSDDSSPFYTRGTFHELSDREDIGWHPRYEEELKHIK